LSAQLKTKDPSNPKHYTQQDPQPIDVIEDWKLNFHLGCALKYVGRYTRKNGREDLEKALWYLARADVVEKRYKPSHNTDEELDNVDYDPSLVSSNWNLPTSLRNVVDAIYVGNPLEAFDYLKLFLESSVGRELK